MSSIQHSYYYIIGVNNDVWSLDVSEYRDYEGAITRGNYIRIPYVSNVKYIISASSTRLIYITNDGELMSGISIIESSIKTAFRIDTDNYDELCIAILYNSGKLIAVNLDEYNDTINHRLIADGINNIYPMSILVYPMGVQRVDSFLMEESNSYVVIRYCNVEDLIVIRLKINRPILVKKGIIMTIDCIYLFGIIDGKVGYHKRRTPLRTKDCINYTSPSGKRTILFISNNGDLTDHNNRLIGVRYDRFVHFEYGRGVTVIGNDQKTYEVNVHVWDSLLDKNIPIVIS